MPFTQNDTKNTFPVISLRLNKPETFLGKKSSEWKVLTQKPIKYEWKICYYSPLLGRFSISEMNLKFAFNEQFQSKIKVP